MSEGIEAGATAKDADHGVPAPQVRAVGFPAPLTWLARGWGDFRATGFRGIFYGIVFALMGIAISAVYATRWQLTMGLVAGFFLVGPFVCTGTYELSRQRERGERISLRASLSCWRRNTGSIGFFAAVLTFAMIVWARVSIVLFALFSTTDFPTLKSVLAQIVSPSNYEFLAVWGGVGLGFATLVFAISVVSIPLMLDRGTDTMMAVFSSVRSLALSPGPLYFWASIIVLLLGVSMIAGFLPLIFTAPLLGHATWHAYRDLVAEDGRAPGA
jgi:uncharacterized membrane protein